MRLAPRALCRAARAAWRENFSLDGRDVARWFPGHMAKGEARRRVPGVPGAGGSGRPGADLIPESPRGPSPASGPAA